MRTSIASLALIVRRNADETEYLAQWNADWSAFNFIGGHKVENESFRECLAREIGEELGLSSDGYSIAFEPTAHLEYVATSRRTGGETAYTIELFEVELGGELVRGEIERRKENAWLSAQEITGGAALDGRAISPTMALLLSKTGRSQAARQPETFKIGVTGHRDLRNEDREQLSQRLEAIFDGAERAAGGRAIEALSPLAAGADQLFAEIALVRGYRLLAPLPLPLQSYRHDFSDVSATHFERLLHSAAEWYSLPLVEQSAQANGNNEPVRDLMYEAVGRHVVERSDLLIALWNGVTNGKRGGTGEIVEFGRHAVAAGQPLRIEIVPTRRAGQT